MKRSQCPDFHQDTQSSFLNGPIQTDQGQFAFCDFFNLPAIVYWLVHTLNQKHSFGKILAPNFRVSTKQGALIAKKWSF